MSVAIIYLINTVDVLILSNIRYYEKYPCFNNKIYFLFIYLFKYNIKDIKNRIVPSTEIKKNSVLLLK